MMGRSLVGVTLLRLRVDGSADPAPAASKSAAATSTAQRTVMSGRAPSVLLATAAASDQGRGRFALPAGGSAFIAGP